MLGRGTQSFKSFSKYFFESLYYISRFWEFTCKQNRLCDFPP